MFHRAARIVVVEKVGITEQVAHFDVADGERTLGRGFFRAGFGEARRRMSSEARVLAIALVKWPLAARRSPIFSLITPNERRVSASWLSAARSASAICCAWR